MIADEIVAPLEDLISPRQYLLHIQAVPLTHSDPDISGVQRPRTLSELGRATGTTSSQGVESKWQNISSRTNSTFPATEDNIKSSLPNHRGNTLHFINDEYNSKVDKAVASHTTTDKVSSPLQKVRSSSRFDTNVVDIRQQCPRLTKNRNDTVGLALSDTTEYEPESVSK